MSGEKDPAVRGPRLGIVDVGRGIAATLVVFHHVGNMMAEPRFFAVHPFSGHLRNFNVGVDFFFVLSGFLISWIHWKDIGKREAFAGYAHKRFVRIYPPYWVVLLPLILFYLAIPHAGGAAQHDPGNMLLSITLLPGPMMPVLGIAWTLQYEMLFYALFGCLILLGRGPLLLLPFWAIAILVAPALGTSSFPASFFLSPFNIEFLLGIVVAVALRTGTLPAPGAIMAAGGVLFFGTMMFGTSIQDNMLVARIIFGAGSALFIAGAAEFERRRQVELPTILRLLGAASFSIYLVHTVILAFLVPVAARLLHHHLPEDIVALLLGVTATCFGIGFHLLIEKPLLTYSRRMIAPRPAKARPLSTTQAISEKL